MKYNITSASKPKSAPYNRIIPDCFAEKSLIG